MPANPARKAGRLTADLHLSICSSKSNSQVSSILSSLVDHIDLLLKPPFTPLIGLTQPLADIPWEPVGHNGQGSM